MLADRQKVYNIDRSCLMANYLPFVIDNTRGEYSVLELLCGEFKHLLSTVCDRSCTASMIFFMELYAQLLIDIRVEVCQDTHIFSCLLLMVLISITGQRP